MKQKNIKRIIDALIKWLNSNRAPSPQIMKSHTAQVKICKDCIYVAPAKGWFLGDGHKWEYAKCKHPASRRINFITGVTSNYFCSTERVHDCGAEGKYYINKHSLTN